MENTIFRSEGTENSVIEFNVVKTNFIPYRDKRELGINVTIEDKQLYFSFSDTEDIQELINYLENVKNYCSEFNIKSKPIKENE